MADAARHHEPSPVAIPPSLADQAVAACPYLLAAGGGWKASLPHADHRCTAFAPAAPLAPDKQRRLCLSPSHTGCATFLAAVAARGERGVGTDARDVLGWDVARTTPIVDAGVGIGSTVTGMLSERKGWQGLLGLVLVLALAAVVASNLGRSPGVAVDGSPSPSAASPSPTPTRTPSPTPTPVDSPLVTPAASPAATPTAAPTASPVAAATAAPSARTTYTVRANDTLYGIAQEFGVTVAALMQLNGLTSTTIHAGLVLKIP